MSWFETLQPASLGGVPFGVLGGQLRVGRRNAVHTYPYKDEVWVEDLGRDARRITLIGFLVEKGAYGGGSVISQREQMVAACEAPGLITLVHPTLGSVQVSLLEANFSERWDQGRVFEIAFSFVEGGQRVFPTDDVDPAAAVLEACDVADVAVATDFVSEVVTALGSGAAVVNMVVTTATAWAGMALSLVADATNLMNTVVGLPGSFGRFFGASLRGVAGLLRIDTKVGGSSGPARASVTTVSGLIASGTAARSAVSQACTALKTSAGGIGATTAASFAAAAQKVPATLLTSTPDPGDSIRVLTRLAQFTPDSPTPESAVGTAMATAQRASGDLFRRSAVLAVCRASASYQPSSYDDTVTVRNRVSELLDAEIQIAGDQGEDGTYNELRNVRAVVVQSLTARGANLAKLMTVNTPRPMPALALAQRVYRDGGRGDELTVESGCVHPAFMPTSFRALAE